MEDPLNDTGVRGLPYDQRANQRVGKVMRASSRDSTPHVYNIASNQ